MSSLWSIATLESLNDGQRENLAKLLIPAKPADITLAISKMLAHFPKRDATRDVIIQTDVAQALSKKAVSLAALVDVCQDFWMEATADNPWPPLSSEIYSKILKRTESYIGHINRLTRPMQPAIEHKPVADNFILDHERPQSPHYKWVNGKKCRIFEGTEWDNFTEADKMLAANYYSVHCLPNLRELFISIQKLPDDIAAQFRESVGSNV